MKQDQKDVLNKYAEIKKDIKELEEQAKTLNLLVLEALQENSLEEVELDTGKITLASRRTWKYPSFIKEKIKEIKDIKKEAEQTGSADYTEKHYIVFSEKKHE